MTDQTTHDFGGGPVPAHRHRNPDGSLGGWVADTATVAPTAYIGPDARVYDAARVSGDACVSGDARVSRARHALTVGPVGSAHRHVTVWRHADGGARITAGCWTGTIDDLAARIAPGGGHDWPADTEARWRADYETVIALARPREAEWAEATAVVAS